MESIHVLHSQQTVQTECILVQAVHVEILQQTASIQEAVAEPIHIIILQALHHVIVVVELSVQAVDQVVTAAVQLDAVVVAYVEDNNEGI